MKKNYNQATGILDDLSSKLECCRDKVLPLKVFDFAIDALAHDSAKVRTPACVFLENIFCSMKNLSAGHFMSETVVLPLVQLLCNSCMSVQISALRAISNVAVDFKQHKSLFTQSVANNSVQVQLGNSPQHRYFHPFYVPLV
ncbi:armadillo repeat-containing protein 8 [Dorcoceras hygrometricum]|uniref:Armadillo repeat-containing protein 8 n=1 Tax=Dorcoceras hygrometricum TaxID=472368 RepID=A0A2Z7AK83_9LAMI|nr:armadillo repeat-containing protein 8 [Dorcoceras hygrometricum]